MSGYLKAPLKLNVPYTADNVQVSGQQPFRSFVFVHVRASYSFLLSTLSNLFLLSPSPSFRHSQLNSREKPCSLFFVSAGWVEKMKAMQVISLTLLLVAAASALVLKSGRCPNAPVQANFDASRVNTVLLFPLLYIMRYTQGPALWQKLNTEHVRGFIFSVWNIVLPLQYLGKWYEIQKLPTTFQKGQCTNAIYSLKGPGEINVLNSELLWVNMSRKKMSTFGETIEISLITISHS